MDPDSHPASSQHISKIGPPDILIDAEENIQGIVAASERGDLDAVQARFATCKSALSRIGKNEPASEEGDLTPLHVALERAVERNHTHIVLYLLDQGISIYANDFVLAAQKRSFVMLKLFIEHGWDINHPMGWREGPPLTLALNDEPLLRWFLAHGADPNTTIFEEDDFTVLSLAVAHGSFATIKILFERGGGDVHRGQLLHCAVGRGAMGPPGARNVASTKAVPRSMTEDECLPVIDYLLSKGANVDGIKYQNDAKTFFQHQAFGLGTPLHVAAEVGNLTAVEHLLIRGADPNVKNTRGQLAYERAEYFGHLAIVKVLRALKGDVAEKIGPYSGHIGHKPDEAQHSGAIFIPPSTSSRLLVFANLALFPVMLWIMSTRSPSVPT
ncbi:ankyrin [Xylona heveae TC161]|uniref:Ankyrin n=1 Tax=Xylona heveae (strain CBS 132557 / TC161) TaxID=1328760 RepID=A0A165ACY4_XYLHT|nr:ankyrin [Xylona heveae TC161]KZF20271.1 ankyrin [Xylona heveae TC161]